MNRILLGSCLASLSMLLYCQSAEKKTSPSTSSAAFSATIKPAPAVAHFGALKVKGNVITGQDGKPAQLNGMSLFWSQWIGKYYDAATVKWLKEDWNCNVIRAAMAIEYGGYLEHPEREKKKIFAVIDAAVQEGIYVIVDWHDHHGENHLAEAKAFFADVAQRYGHLPNVIYEPYNEPLDVSWTNVLKPYHQAIIDTIRHYDPDNLIVCGTPNWSQDVEAAAADPLTDSNVAYTLHFYAGTHRQNLRDKASAALRKGVALMVTEYGTTQANGDDGIYEEETKVWWQFMDEHHLSGCNWSVADKDESSAALKPGTAATGKWTEDMITPSGILVRNKLRGL
jgi:endoglucanase